MANPDIRPQSPQTGNLAIALAVNLALNLALNLAGAGRRVGRQPRIPVLLIA